MHETSGPVGRNETAAEIYDRLFLPSLAGPWAIRLADAVGLAPGDRVLDVACGTGAVAGEAAARVQPGGVVAGLDPNPDMLDVARGKLPDLDLRNGRAEALPFDEDAFDVVICQFGLMFFDDPGQGLREMLRVLRPGGRLAVAVWDQLERTPGYAALTDLAERHLGREAGKPIRSAFALGDVGLLRSLLVSAGFSAVDAESVDAPAIFPSLQAWVEAEVKGWVGGGFSDDEYDALMEDAHAVLARYERPDGTVEFALPAVVATGSKS